MIYLSVDSGGTKTAAVLFDENARVLSSKTARLNMRVAGRILAEATPDFIAFFAELFAPLSTGEPITVEEILIVDGSGEVVKTGLPAFVTVKNLTVIGEPRAAILAGALRRTGFIALAGTGSDVFYIEEGTGYYVVGSLGPIFGDEGSGTWIGREVLAAATHYHDGWGEKTSLWHLLCEKFGMREDGISFQLCQHIYRAENPYAVLASLPPLAVSAANGGDAVATDIFRRGAQMLAAQTAACVRFTGVKDDKTVTLCGGIFRGYPKMVDFYTEALKKELPDYTVKEPIFTHVVAGAVEILLRRNVPNPEAILRERFSAFLWRN